MPDPILRLTDDHRYFLGDREMAGVTDVLTDQGILPDYRLLDPFYAERGQFLHEAIALDLRGELDEDSVDEALYPYLERARWAIERVIAPDIEWPVGDDPTFRIEHSCYNIHLSYAGTLDFDDGHTVWDWKTTAGEPGHRVQVAAYCLLAGRHRGAVVSLGSDPPKVEWLSTLEVLRLQKVFLGALAAYRWRQEFRPQSLRKERA